MESKFKVGDKVRVVKDYGSGYDPTDIVGRVGVLEEWTDIGIDKVDHPFQVILDGNAEADYVNKVELVESLELINPLEVDEAEILYGGTVKMKKPETELEKNALALAKKEAIEEEIKVKAVGYKDTMRNFITESHTAKRHQAKADEYADVLGITDEEKKELL